MCIYFPSKEWSMKSGIPNLDSIDVKVKSFIHSPNEKSPVQLFLFGSSFSMSSSLGFCCCWSLFGLLLSLTGRIIRLPEDLCLNWVDLGKIIDLWLSKKVRKNFDKKQNIEIHTRIGSLAIRDSLQKYETRPNLSTFFSLSYLMVSNILWYFVPYGDQLLPRRPRPSRGRLLLTQEHSLYVILAIAFAVGLFQVVVTGVMMVVVGRRRGRRRQTVNPQTWRWRKTIFFFRFFNFF